MTIIDYIPKGKDNKISRDSLTICTGMCDRRVREHISLARAEGYPIVGDPEGGYYMAENQADINLLLGELMSRMGKLAKCYTAIKKKWMGAS